MESNQDNLLSTAKKALQVLKSFTKEEPEKKVTDIAASLGMNKSNVSRLLATLASEGFVTKDPETQKYRLGLAIIPLHESLTSGLEVRREAEPFLQKLVDEVGETANITVYRDFSIIDVLRVNSKHPVQIVSHVSVVNPVHCTSAGKIFLAYEEEKEIKKYIEDGHITTSGKSFRIPADFLSMLAKVKHQGYATSVEELFEGIATIATPVRDYTGKVIYALSILGPVHRFNPHNPTVIAKAKKYAREISLSLGYRGNEAE